MRLLVRKCNITGIPCRIARCGHELNNLLLLRIAIKVFEVSQSIVIALTAAVLAAMLA